MENYGISFEHGVEKFQSKSLSFFFKICKMVIYVEIHEMFSVVELTKTVASTLNILSLSWIFKILNV